MACTEEKLKKIEGLIKNVPDFPKKGILFRDIFPIMRDPATFGELIDIMTDHIKENYKDVETIVGLDARGFIFGPMMAQKLGIGFIPIRKKGKLPGETVSASYTLEYGTDEFEAQIDSVSAGQKVVIVDDLLATGGTMSAAHKLMKSMGAVILECMVVIELADLNGREKIPGKTFALFVQRD